MRITQEQIDNVGPAIEKIFDLWQLTIEERDQLIPECSLNEMTLRVSYILGIYKALQSLLPHSDNADTWIKKPNAFPMYEGYSALEYIIKNGIVGLKNVKEYLDCQCYG